MAIFSKKAEFTSRGIHIILSYWKRSYNICRKKSDGRCIRCHEWERKRVKIGDIGNREREWDKEGKGESFCLMIFWWPSFSCIAFFSFSWCIFLSFSKWSVSFFFKYIILLFLLKIPFVLIAPPFPSTRSRLSIWPEIGKNDVALCSKK